jgi:arylsulfatase A-like enzyme
MPRPHARFAALFLFAAAACAPPASPPPDVVLVTVDTLRADHLGAYGAPPNQTPYLDAFAEQATVFENAAAAMPLTRPSHFSMLTSLYPREHVTVAELFAEHGYRTGAFLGVRLLDHRSGVGQGFEVLDTPEQDRQRVASEVTLRASAWVKSLGPDEPFFLWVHVFDPHQPYEGLGSHDGADPNLMRSLPRVDWKVLYQVAGENGGEIPKAVLEHSLLLYRGDVSYTDQTIGQLLEDLSRLRDPDRTLTLVTADHGECFERGFYFEHADCIHEGALRVPFMVRYPPQFSAGARRRVQVSGVDVAPTLLRGAGLPVPEHFSGLAVQDLEENTERYVLAQLPFYDTHTSTTRLPRRKAIEQVAGDPFLHPNIEIEQVALVGPRWKLLRGLAPEGDRETLYAMVPEADSPAGDATVKRRLGEALTQALSDHPLHVVNPGRINPELIENLRALGYIE